MLSVVLVMTVVLSSLAYAAPPKVVFNEKDFRDRVYACWLGKNIGGTLGMPFEGGTEAHNIDFYTNIKGEPAANDDLDLQLLWLKAMEEHNGQVDTRILGEYWLKFVPVDWNEYGVGKKNMRRGWLPPLSGNFRNDEWKQSNGAWIRSEIWACLAPGNPALAARFAREDACVDHGAAEGTLAEIFTASLESAAFVEHDINKLIDIGLAMVPHESELAGTIRAAVASKKAGKDWKQARLDVMAASEKFGWFQAPRNVAFTVIGLLYGEDDFGKTICIAVNCGDDTDCTGATAGSIMGILHGTKEIPQKWITPVGDRIVNVAISGFQAPKTLDELTIHTVAMTKRVAARYQLPVTISAGPSDLRNVSKLKLIDTQAAKALWALSPYQIIWNTTDTKVTLDYLRMPVIVQDYPRTLRVTVRNTDTKPHAYQLTLSGLPADWTVSPKLPVTVNIEAGQSVTQVMILLAKSVSIPNTEYKMGLSITGGTQNIEIPVMLVSVGAVVEDCNANTLTMIFSGTLDENTHGNIASYRIPGRKITKVDVAAPWRTTDSPRVNERVILTVDIPFKLGDHVTVETPGITQSISFTVSPNRMAVGGLIKEFLIGGLKKDIDPMTVLDGEILEVKTLAPAVGAKWKLAKSDTGIFDLLKEIGNYTNVVAFAHAYVHADSDCTVQIRTGSDDDVKVYVNGEALFKNSELRGLIVDADQIPNVKLHKGWNSLLLEVPQSINGWGVAARILSAEGGTPAGISYQAARPEDFR